MAYEKPKLVDLSAQPEKGFGKGCMTGSGDVDACVFGETNTRVCQRGGLVQQGPDLP